MDKRLNNKHFLLNYFFVIGLLILAFNDHILKWEFGNYLTGKLSDFTGVFILPFFISFLFPKTIRVNIVITALFFIFWKSPFSEDLIHIYNQYAPIEIVRVIDYSDLLALLVLPFSYFIIKKVIPHEKYQIRLKMIPVQVILFFTILTFIATSPPRSFFYRTNAGDLSCLRCQLSIKHDKDFIIEKLLENKIGVYKDSTLKENNYRYARYLNDSTLQEEVFFYRIDNLILEKDTLPALQFSLVPKSKKRTKVLINGFHIKKEHQDKDDFYNKKLSRNYKKQVKEWFRKMMK